MRFIGTLTFAFEADDLEHGHRIAKDWHGKVVAASQRTSMHFRPGTVVVQPQPQMGDRSTEDDPISDEPERLFDAQ